MFNLHSKIVKIWWLYMHGSDAVKKDIRTTGCRPARDIALPKTIIDVLRNPQKLELCFPNVDFETVFNYCTD